MPDGFREATLASRAAARAGGMAVERATSQVLTDLSAAGIRAMPLKGPSLAVAAHGEVGLRQTADIDVLVAQRDLQPAAAILRRVGFAHPDRSPSLPDLHLSFQHEQLPRLELHWRVHWYESAFAQDMLRRAELDYSGRLTAQPADMLASLLLFYARDGFHGVRHAADIGGWWDRHSELLAPAVLEDHARRYPELVPALTAAAIAAESAAGVPALTWLGRHAAGGRRISVATRLATWSQTGDHDQLKANISLVGGLLGPPRSLRAFVRRELRGTGDDRLEETTHAVKMCARYGLALWRVRGSRSWEPLPAH